MEYKNGSYKRHQDFQLEWCNGGLNLNGYISNDTEYKSAVLFLKELKNKDILVSSDFFKKLDKKRFTNPNYVNNDVKFGAVYTCIGS